MRTPGHWAGLQYIVGVNPFVQLFFYTLSIPCITVGDKRAPEERHCLAVLSAPPPDLKGLNGNERRHPAIDLRLSRFSSERFG
jgi:hypothetical protein